MLGWIVAGLVALIALAFWWIRARRDRLQRALFDDLVAVRERRSAQREPDMQWAARGFAHIADTRRFNLSNDLETVEWTFARMMEGEEGANPLQLMSCRWGAGHAMEGDLSMYYTGLEGFQETLKAEGKTKDDFPPLTGSRVAALGYLNLIVQQAPNDFTDFLRAVSAGEPVGLRL